MSIPLQERPFVLSVSLFLSIPLLSFTLITASYAQQIGAPIVIAEAPSGEITICNGLTRICGDPFQTTFDSDANGGQDALAVGDLNRDLLNDIVIVEAPSGAITIFDQLGQNIGGPFSTPFDSDVRGEDALAVGDLTGDGKVEIVIAEAPSGKITVFSSLVEGQRIGMLTFGVSFSTGFDSDVGGQDALAVGDDIVIAEAPSGTITIFNRLGQRVGGPFRTTPRFDSDINGGQDALAVGDVTGDGVDEIVLAEAPSGAISVFDRSGQRIVGPFPTSFDSDVGGEDALAVGDIAGDARAEIVIAEANSGAITVFDQTGQRIGVPFPTSFDSNPGGQDAVAVGNINERDSDGDGLLDSWESFGFDGNGDGFSKNDPNDVDLPGFNADPMHKDLFLELDWMTGQQTNQAAIRAVKAAFALAPIDAGGVSNPDGKPGINLWVDTGALTDPNGNEDGFGVNTCGDTFDNGGDGATDAGDTDCLVGDNLGGGNTFPASSICNVNDPDFYAAKGQNFATNRRFIFRYGISGRGCDLNMDGRIDSGGWGEIGGNDFIEYTHGGGIVMHEFGHNLNLRHGGDVNANCKPNYVSVMNYDNQLGINQIFPAGAGMILDYSPPRFGSEDGAGLRTCEDGIDNGSGDGEDADDSDCLGRGAAPLNPDIDGDGNPDGLIENNLNEATVLDATDPINQFIFKNGLRQRMVWQLNGDRNGDGIPDGIDWDGDMIPPNPGTLGSGLIVNIDTSTNVPPGASPPNFSPAGCTNNSTSSTLTGFNDWANISVPFRQFGDSQDGAINPVTEPEPILEDLIQMQQAINTIDLSITKASDPDTVEVGADFTYTLTVINKGPNPAGRVEVVDIFPSEVSYERDNAGCVTAPSEEAPAGILICDLGAMLPGTQRQIEIVVGTAGANEGPVINTATVENIIEFAGPDLEPTDNSTTVSTMLVTPTSTCAGLIPSIVGTDGNDSILGTEAPDVIQGLGGNDTISGRGGDDIVCGGDGGDTIFGHAGADRILGEAGDDDLFGGDGNDDMDGGDGRDRLFGAVGDDRLFGGTQRDRLFGNDGNDELSGGLDNDRLFGQAGDDDMDGGAKFDHCNGGVGTADTAVNCERIPNVP